MSIKTIILLVISFVAGAAILPNHGLREHIVRQKLCVPRSCQKCFRVVDFMHMKGQSVTPLRSKCIRILLLPDCCTHQLRKWGPHFT